LYRDAISLFGLSKSFGLPGLRMGWLVTKNHGVLGRVAELKDYTTICHSAPSEILAIVALQNRDVIIERQMQRVQRNITVLEAFLTEYNHCFQWNRPVGSSICFPRLMLEKDASEFCEELVRDTGILLAPSSLFQFGNKHVRIGFGRENLPEVIDRFAAYLDQYEDGVVGNGK
jgi:aspartate/methionine/tyrosine aminotransferase